MPAIGSVFTIRRVARMLGEDEDWLHEISTVMMPEDGACWIYDLDDDRMLAFTREGIDNLRELIQTHRETPLDRRRHHPGPDRPLTSKSTSRPRVASTGAGS